MTRPGAAEISPRGSAEPGSNHSTRPMPRSWPTSPDASDAAPEGGSSDPPSFEREIMLHLTRAGYLLFLEDDEPQADLPFVELQKFLHSLSPEQALFISHLTRCERCLHAVAKTLKPPAVPPPRNLVIVI